MKIRTIVYGETFEVAKAFLEEKILPSYGKDLIKTLETTNFIRFETEKEIIHTHIKGQMPSRCHRLFYDSKVDSSFLESCLAPLVNLGPPSLIEIIPF